MSNPDQGFDQPSSGNWLGPKDRDGHLLLITVVHEIEPAYDRLKDADADRAEFDFVDLDDLTDLGPNGLPRLQQNVYDNHAGIVRKMKPSMRSGRGILGRIGQAPTDKGNAAWVLGPYTEGVDDKRATAWLNANKNSKFTQPSEPAAAPTATPKSVPAQPRVAATPAATPTKPVLTVNGVEVDPEQFVKLANLGIVTPTTEQAQQLAAMGFALPVAS